MELDSQVKTIIDSIRRFPDMPVFERQLARRIAEIVAASRSPTADPEKDFEKLLKRFEKFCYDVIGAENDDEDTPKRYEKAKSKREAARQSLVDAYYEKHTCVGTECGWYKTTVELRAALAALREENERLNRRLDEWSETEASVCPEDWGFVEYIKQLETSFNRTAKEFLAAQAELASLRSSVLTRRQAEHILRIRQARAHWFQSTCLCAECEDTELALRCISSANQKEVEK